MVKFLFVCLFLFESSDLGYETNGNVYLSECASVCLTLRWMEGHTDLNFGMDV